MGRIGRSVALAALLVTQACWLQVGAGPQRRGSTDLETQLTSETVSDLTVAWSVPAGGDVDEVLIYGGSVYAPSGSGAITRLDADDGETRWTWTPSHNRSAPAIADGRLWVAAGGDRCVLVGVDLATGRPVDLLAVGPPPIPYTFPDRVSMCGPSEPIVSGTTVTVVWHFIGHGDVEWCDDVGYLQGPGATAVDVDDGTVRWEWLDDTDSGCGPLPPNYPSPLFNSSAPGPDGLVVRGELGAVRAVDCGASGCHEAWSVPFDDGPLGPPVVTHSGDVVVRNARGQLSVIDGGTHTVEWTADLGEPTYMPLAANASHIVVAGNDGTLAAFPATGCGAPTCEPLWTATLPAEPSARPSIGADVVYVGTGDGTVSAFDLGGCGAPTCEPLWTGTTPGAVTRAPAIADGRVIVGSRGGTVTAFALADP